MLKSAAPLALLCLTCCGSPTAPTQDAASPALDQVFALMDADSWVHPMLQEPVGPWVRRELAGVPIHLDPTLSDAISARADVTKRQLFWRPKNADISLARQASILLHEARHFQGYRHTCGSVDLSGDRTMAEGGPFAVQIVYLEHMGDMPIATWLRENYIGC